MRIAERFNAAVKALFSPSEAINKNLGLGTPIGWGNSFTWSLSGMRAYHNKIFYSAQNTLVRKLTEAPIMFSEKKPGSAKKLEKFYSSNISNEKRALIKAQNLKEVENHKLNELFDKPNDYQSGIEMMEAFWYNYGYGDGFLYFETLGDLSRDKTPYAVHCLTRCRVTPNRSNARFNPILSYSYICQNGEMITIPANEILHLKHWNPNIDELKGYGVDQAAAMDISLNNSNNEAQGAAFKNGGRATLFSSDVVSDAQEGIVEKMTDEQMKVLKKTMESDYEGLKNYRKWHYTNGKVEVQNIGDTPAEMELVQSEDSNWKNIYTISGVPWALSPAASSVSENSIIVGHKSLVTNTVLPETKKLDQKLTQTAQQWWPNIVAVTDVTEFSELAPDYKALKETIGSPLLTVDEVRNAHGYDAVGGEVGGAILVASGMMKIEDILSDAFSDVPPPNSPDSPDNL